MVQEVQTSVERPTETTLETIEAIGTSSIKIIEGRQTRGGHYGSNCKASGTASRYYASGGERESEEIESADMTISSMSGKQEFLLKEGGIRVPSSGTYQITLTWSGGSSSSEVTVILKGGDRVLYTKHFDANNTETVTIPADLGKFDLIEVRGEFYYKGSASAATVSISYSLDIQQL